MTKTELRTIKQIVEKNRIERELKRKLSIIRTEEFRMTMQKFQISP